MMAVSGRSTPLKNVSGSLRKGCWNTTIQIPGSTQVRNLKMWLIATAKMKTMWRSLPTSWTSFKKKSIHIERTGGTSFRGAKACLLKCAINSTARVSGLYPASSGFESLMAYQLGDMVMFRRSLHQSSICKIKIHGTLFSLRVNLSGIKGNPKMHLGW